MKRFRHILLLLGACSAMPFEALSDAFLVNGLEGKLQVSFPEEPEIAVRKAVAGGLVRAIGDEGLNLHDVVCNRDYAVPCPTGWADAGDGNTCFAPLDYQGPCGPKITVGGMAPERKRLEAARCEASYPCLGACTSDLVATCPIGWREDVNSDCLAPVGYTGQCVMRKKIPWDEILREAAVGQELRCYLAVSQENGGSHGRRAGHRLRHL